MQILWFGSDRHLHLTTCVAVNVSEYEHLSMSELEHLSVSECEYLSVCT